MSAPEGYTLAGAPAFLVCHTCGGAVIESLVDAHERSHGNWLRASEVNGAAPRDLGAEVDQLKRDVRQHTDQLWSSRCQSYYRPGGLNQHRWVQCSGNREDHAPSEGRYVIHRGQDSEGAWHEWGDS